MSLTEPGAKDPSVTRKPTPIGFQKHVENISVARADTQQSLFISEKAQGNVLQTEIGDMPWHGTPKHRASPFAAASQKFNTILPRNKRYCFGRLSRKAFLIMIGVASMCLLIIVVAPAAVLSHRSSQGQDQNLPLPDRKETFSGELTFFQPALGACGVDSTSEENIVAIAHEVFDRAQTGTNPNDNPLCGLKIRATRFNELTNSQRSVDLTVVDRCEKCKPTDIDVTISAFLQLGDEQRGRIPVTWAWLS